MKFLLSYHSLLFLLLLTVNTVFTGCADNNPPQPLHPEAEKQKEWAIEGTVLSYASNNIGEIDRLIIEINQKKTGLHFPPHAAQKIIAIAKPATTVQVVVDNQQGPLHEQGANYHLISLTAAGGKTIVVSNIAPPPPSQRGEEATITGKATDVWTDSEGRVRSFVVNKTIVTLPPHVGMNLADDLNKANNVAVKGYLRMSGNGFVNNRGSGLIRPYSISIDGTTYTIE